MRAGQMALSPGEVKMPRILCQQTPESVRKGYIMASLLFKPTSASYK